MEIYFSLVPRIILPPSGSPTMGSASAPTVAITVPFGPVMSPVCIPFNFIHPDFLILEALLANWG